MHGPRKSPERSANANNLALAMTQVRQQTLALMEAWHLALPDLQVPYAAGLNPPLWEWGHVAWFQEWWTVRHPQPELGTRGHAEGRHGPSILPGADGLYNSSTVAHASRWALPLPDLGETRDYLARVSALSHKRLAEIQGDPDDHLYFWRLALFHEAMHNEASVYMAQALGIDLPQAITRRSSADSCAMGPESALHVPSGRIELGHVGPGFAFDNEVGSACIEWPAFEIDARPVSWGRYLTFAHETGHPVPDPLRHDGTQWWIRSGSHWQPLPLSAPATHLSALDAEAWCAWAGRQLPTEAQWSAAVAASGFEWGEVWEWTRTPFAPFQGFVAHPYEDYSAPWWHTHRVLKGASWATPECMVDHRFRNFYLPRRTDLLAGFRTVAAG